MVIAVLAVRALLDRAGLHVRYLDLAIEVVCGGAAAVGGAFLFARPVVRDLLQIASGALRRRRAPDAAAGAGAE
jgi:hypothetical protein